MSSCAVGSGKRSRSEVPAAIFASIALNVAVVAAMRVAAGGAPWQDGADGPASAAPVSAGLANATPAASRLPAPALSRDLATIMASMQGRSEGNRLGQAEDGRELAEVGDGVVGCAIPVGFLALAGIEHHGGQADRKSVE